MKASTTLRRWPQALLALALVGTLLVPSLAAAADSPPDQVDPPAPGEGEPLADPSDPPPSDFSTASYPTVDLEISGPRWRGARLDAFVGGSRFGTAVKASRRGWPRPGTVVLAPAGDAYLQLVAAGVAGTVHGPLLLTKVGGVPRVTRREIGRLDRQRSGAIRIVMVGPLADAARTTLQRLGRLTQLAAGSRTATSIKAAGWVADHGGAPGTVFVAGTRRIRPSVGASALAADGRHPVLLTRGARDNTPLRRAAQRLGVRRTLVIGRRRDVSDDAVAGLPNRDRLAGSTALRTGLAVATRGRMRGLDGRVSLVRDGRSSTAVVAGVLAGGPREGVVVPTRGRQLAKATMGWWNRFEPRRATVVGTRRQVPLLARCQVHRGGYRLWRCAEGELKRQGYLTGKVDGRRGAFSIWAVFAFEKVAGRTANGSFGKGEWRAMVRRPRVKLRRPDLPSTHLEINIDRQLILMVAGGKVRHYLHTSTGKASTPTIRGTFSVYEMRPYRQDNGIYKGIFFYGGYAIHGYPHIPTYPASHGCARTYDGNQDFLFSRVFVGERVATY